MLAEADRPIDTSRRSTHKSTSGRDAEIPAISETGPTGEAPLPTIEDVVDEFYAKYPKKARTFLVHDGGDDPREPRVELREDVVEILDGGDALPVTEGGALRAFLEWHAEREGTRGRFRNGSGDTFEKELLNSYDPAYIERYYARLMGLSREVVGGERPTGEWTAGEYDEPTTALLSLTSSGTDDRGNPRAPVDHLLERREAWGPTYKRLYDRMEALVDEGRINDWMYLVVEEHHPGGGWGLNAGLGHDHPLVIVDGELRAEDLEPVVDAWVENCPSAGADAHEGAIEIFDVDAGDVADLDVMNSIGGYVTKYLYPDGGDAELRERSVEQLAYQSMKWATNTRRVRKSDVAGEAIRADRCRQAHDRGDQELEHGAQLAHRPEGRGPEVVCAACGSSWGVDGADGAETLVDARRAADVDEHPGETEGKPQDSGPISAESGEDCRQRERWRDARAGASSAGWSFRRPWPTGWELEAVLVQDDDAPDGVRECRPSPGGGVATVPVRGVDQVLESQHAQGNEGLADFLEQRRERDRRGDAPPEPDLPIPGGWDRPPPAGERGASTYAATHEPTQSDRRALLRQVVRDLEGVSGAPVDEVLDELEERDVSPAKAEHAVRSLLERGELYEPASGRLRVT